MLTIMSIFLLDKVHCAQLIVSLFPLSGQGGAGSLATQKIRDPPGKYFRGSHLVSKPFPALPIWVASGTCGSLRDPRNSEAL